MSGLVLFDPRSLPAADRTASRNYPDLPWSSMQSNAGPMPALDPNTLTLFDPPPASELYSSMWFSGAALTR